MKKGYTIFLLAFLLLSVPVSNLSAQTTLTRENAVQLAPQLISALQNFSVALEGERERQVEERAVLVQTQLLLTAISNRLVLSGGNITQAEIDSISADLGVVRAQLSSVANRRLQVGVVFDGVIKTFGSIITAIRGVV